MARLERTYTIPLRQEYRKAPRYKRAARAMSALQAFLLKHMKGTDVKIGKYLNEEVWKDGIKNPPHKVKVTAFKEDDSVVKAELFGKEYVEKKVEKKDDKPQGKLQEKLAELKETAKDEKKEEKPSKPSANADVKDELKKLKENAKTAVEDKAKEVVEKVEKEEKPKAAPAKKEE